MINKISVVSSPEATEMKNSRHWQNAFDEVGFGCVTGMRLIQLQNITNFENSR